MCSKLIDLREIGSDLHRYLCAKDADRHPVGFLKGTAQLSLELKIWPKAFEIQVMLICIFKLLNTFGNLVLCTDQSEEGFSIQVTGHENVGGIDSIPSSTADVSCDLWQVISAQIHNNL